MQTDTYEIEGYGKVTVQHSVDWGGRAVIEWQDPVDKKFVERKMPAQLLLLLGRKVAKRSLKNDLMAWLETLPDDERKKVAAEATPSQETPVPPSQPEAAQKP